MANVIIDIEYIGNDAIMYDGVKVPLFPNRGQRDLLVSASDEQKEWMMMWMPVLMLGECGELMGMSAKTVCKLRKALKMKVNNTRYRTYIALNNLRRTNPELVLELSKSIHGRDNAMSRIELHKKLLTTIKEERMKYKKKKRNYRLCNARKDRKELTLDEKMSTTHFNDKEDKVAPPPRTGKRTKVGNKKKSRCLFDKCWTYRNNLCKGDKEGCSFDLSLRNK